MSRFSIFFQFGVHGISVNFVDNEEIKREIYRDNVVQASHSSKSQIEQNRTISHNPVNTHASETSFLK